MCEIMIEYFDGKKELFRGTSFDDALSKARLAVDRRSQSDIAFQSKIRSRRVSSAPIFTIIRQKDL